MIYLCLRFLREFEKWSELGKMGKNGEKKPEPESAIYILLLRKYFKVRVSRLKIKITEKDLLTI